jgi:hypothetical protein
MEPVTWLFIAIGVVIVVLIAWRRFSQYMQDQELGLWNHPKYDNREMYDE